MKIKSELRKANMDENFIKYALMAKLTWEEKVALRDVVRQIASQEGVKKLLKNKKSIYTEFDEFPLGYSMTGRTGLTYNTLITDTAGVDHDTYRSVLLFEDEVEYNTMKEFMGKIDLVRFKASLRTRYNEQRRKGVKGFERTPLNF